MFYQDSNKKSANEIVFMTTFAQIFFKFGQFSTAEIRNSNVFNNQERKIKDVQSSKKILKEIGFTVAFALQIFSKF
jgi:hypothetical protein